MYYVYILRGLRYYVGYTSDLKRRYTEHLSGKVYSTSRMGELTMLGYFELDNEKEARELERVIKKTKNISRRVQKEGFIVI